MKINDRERVKFGAPPCWSRVFSVCLSQHWNPQEKDTVVSAHSRSSNDWRWLQGSYQSSISILLRYSMSSLSWPLCRRDFSDIRPCGETTFNRPSPQSTVIRLSQASFVPVVTDSITVRIDHNHSAICPVGHIGTSYKTNIPLELTASMPYRFPLFCSSFPLLHHRWTSVRQDTDAATISVNHIDRFTIRADGNTPRELSNTYRGR